MDLQGWLPGLRKPVHGHGLISISNIVCQIPCVKLIVGKEQSITQIVVMYQINKVTTCFGHQRPSSDYTNNRYGREEYNIYSVRNSVSMLRSQHYYSLGQVLKLICTDVLSSSTSHLLYGFTPVTFMNCDYSFSCWFMWCEPWSLALWGEHRLRVIVNKVLRKIWTHDEGSNETLEKNA